MATRLALTVFLTILFLADAQAQSAGGGAQNTLLPEINPQDIEIRSEFRARFPGLRRQPILGFNPKPRVFQIDPNRLPFMESKSEAVASIAISQLDRPEPPQRTLMSHPKRGNVWLKSGFGNFMTTEAEVVFFQPISNVSSVNGDLNYTSSDGHTDGSSLSSYRYLDGDVQFRTKVQDKINVVSSIGFLNDFHRMYDLAAIYQTPDNNFDETAKKMYSGLSAMVELNSFKNSLSGWDAALSFRNYSTDIEAGSTNQGGSTSEQVITFGASSQWPGEQLHELLKVGLSVDVGNYSPEDASAKNWLLTELSGYYQMRLGYDLHIKSKAGIAFFNSDSDQKILFTPEIKAEYALGDNITINGMLYGKAHVKTIQELNEQNRFLNPNADVDQSYSSGLLAEIEFQAIKGNKLFAGLNYERINNFAWFERQTEERIGVEYRNFYQVNYSDVTIPEFYAGMTQYLKPETFWFDLRFYMRSPVFRSGSDLFFEEKVGAEAALYIEPINDLKISSWSTFTGKRTTPGNAEDLDAYLLLNASAEYQFTKEIGVYVKLLNILGQKYEVWEGFEERPFQALAGIILKI